jgi:hypothetical protein
MPVDTQNCALSNEELTRLHERTNLKVLLTTEEASALLRLTPQTLRRWACEDSGPIKPRRIGSRLRWPLADIKNLMAGETAAA